MTSLLITLPLPRKGWLVLRWIREWNTCPHKVQLRAFERLSRSRGGIRLTGANSQITPKRIRADVVCISSELSPDISREGRRSIMWRSIGIFARNLSFGRAAKMRLTLSQYIKSPYVANLSPHIRGNAIELNNWCRSSLINSLSCSTRYALWTMRFSLYKRKCIRIHLTSK